MRTGFGGFCLGLIVAMGLAVAPVAAQAIPSVDPRDPLHTSPPDYQVAPPPLDNNSTIHYVDCIPERNPGGAYATLEYLLLTPRRRDLDFAIVDPRDNGRPEGNIESLEWDTASGFRIGGGYRLPDDVWDIGTFYTYIHSHDDRTVTAPLGGTLYATQTHPRAVEEVAVATAATSLEYHVLDVELGKRIPLGEASWIRLFVGPRIAWINQKFRTTYDGRDANVDRVFSRVDYDGGGVRVGGQGFWGIAGGFGVLARASGALLIGDFHSDLSETNNVGATTIVNVSDQFHKVIPVTEVGLGVAWQRRNIRVSAGYELVHWHGLIDSPDFVDDVHRGKLNRRMSDLSLDGLFLELALGF